MPVRFPSPQAALTVAAILFAVVWGVLLAFWHLDGRASVLDRIEAPLVDLRFLLAGPRPAPQDVVIVALDDETVQAAGLYPLPRTKMAELVRNLGRRAPRAIALDILFIDPGPPKGDDHLAEALRESRAVIAAAAMFGRRDDDREVRSEVFADIPVAARIRWPVDRLRQAAGVGLVNVATDHAGTPRHVPLLVRSDEALVPSFTLRVATAAAGAEPTLAPEQVVIGGIASATDLGRNLPLRFYGPRGSIPTLSADQVLRGAVPDERIRDKIVVVGVTALGTSDTFATPFDPVLPGVEVLATAVSHLVTGDGLVRTLATRRVDAAAAVLLPIVTLLLIAVRRVGLGLALVALVMSAWAALAIFAFGSGYWLSMAVPLAALIVPTIVYVAARLWLDRWSERRLDAAHETMRRFHSPALADRLVAAPNYLAEPVQLDAAVLFIDLSGFTSVSERLGPEQTRELLKSLHTLIEDEVTRHGGLVMSYMGDGAMIVFGIPDPQPNDPDRAVQAAMALVVHVASWMDSLPDALHQGLGVRVGAHFGPVVVSRLGADTHQHITATGDSVNVASRLLEVAAAHHAGVAFSTDLLHALRAPLRQPLSDEQEIAIRGRSQPLTVRFWSASQVLCDPDH